MDRQKETSFAWKTNRTPEDAYKMLGECTILSKLSHKHVIGCLGAVNDEPQSIKLFMELAECECAIMFGIHRPSVKDVTVAW